MKDKLLLIDDNLDYLEHMQEVLKPYFDLIVADCGNKGYDVAVTEKPDAILVDGKMPDISGYQLCSMLRENDITKSTPILILTGAIDRDEIEGLNVGADDFLEKPIETEVIVARVNSKIKRYRTMKGVSDKLKYNSIVLDNSRMLLSYDTKEIDLTSLEHRLLRFFFLNPDQIISRERIIESVWGVNLENVNDRTVDVHLANLRKKVSKFPINLKSKYGAGYILCYSDD